MAREVEVGREDLAALPFDSLAGRVGAVTAAAAPHGVTLKLVVAPGAAAGVTAWVRDVGGEVHAAGEEVLIADLPVEHVGRLDLVPGVRRAEAGRELHPRLSDARGTATGLDAALAAHPLTGHGVVVGVIDSGLDWTHDDFRDDAGATRLEFFGHAHRPQGGSQSIFEEYERAAIDAALGGQGQVAQGDPDGHGTHCASIAAGNGRASGETLRGVAPRATLMAVRAEPLLDSHIIWGIRRIFELAGERPAVINLSLGGHWGPHDGSSAIELLVAEESGPGRAIVVAAGNEAEDQIHWQGQLVPGQELVIPFRIGDSNVQFVDVWIPRGDSVDIEIEDPSGARFPPDGQIHSGLFGLVLGDFVEDPVNRDLNLNVRLAGGPVGSLWRIRLTPLAVTQGTVHAWAGTASPATSRHLFPTTTNGDYSLGMPATVERAITVGSFVSRASVTSAGQPLPTPGLVVGGISPFSSRGPARHGAQRPDIAAPGQYVTAALAAGSTMATHPSFVPRHDPSGRYITIQGTSMATPFVAGVVALMLEREPRLGPAEIQRRLRATARRDGLTSAVWNPAFGYGRIDVEALLDHVSPAV